MMIHLRVVRPSFKRRKTKIVKMSLPSRMILIWKTATRCVEIQWRARSREGETQLQTPTIITQRWNYSQGRKNWSKCRKIMAGAPLRTLKRKARAFIVKQVLKRSRRNWIIFRQRTHVMPLQVLFRVKQIISRRVEQTLRVTQMTAQISECPEIWRAPAGLQTNQFRNQMDWKITRLNLKLWKAPRGSHRAAKVTQFKVNPKPKINRAGTTTRLSTCLVRWRIVYHSHTIRKGTRFHRPSSRSHSRIEDPMHQWKEKTGMNIQRRV